jgi:hypothetical protein
MFILGCSYLEGWKITRMVYQLSSSSLSVPPDGGRHKVLTYVEYRAVSASSKILTTHPPLHPASVSSPAPKAGCTHSPGGEGGGGSIFWKTSDKGLASYNNLNTEEGLGGLCQVPRCGVLELIDFTHERKDDWKYAAAAAHIVSDFRLAHRRKSCGD